MTRSSKQSRAIPSCLRTRSMIICRIRLPGFFSLARDNFFNEYRLSSTSTSPRLIIFYCLYRGVFPCANTVHWYKHATIHCSSDWSITNVMVLSEVTPPHAPLQNVPSRVLDVPTSSSRRGMASLRSLLAFVFSWSKIHKPDVLSAPPLTAVALRALIRIMISWYRMIIHHVHRRCRKYPLALSILNI
jgi:hypothetical protein